MATKIIRKPSTTFTIECRSCEAVFEYGIHDISCSTSIQCPCCGYWNDHINDRKKRMEETNETNTKN